MAAMFVRVRLWLRSLLFGRRLERDMHDEMNAHLARATERLMSEGLSQDEARRAARREFGNVAAIQEAARDARGGRLVGSIGADVRSGIRQFVRRPWAALTMIVVLALGIGFNTALFVVIASFVDGTLPGVAAADSLVRIRGGERSPWRGFTIGREFSYPEYQAYVAESSLFSDVAAWTSADVTIDVGQGMEDLQSGAASFVTPSYFPVLGVQTTHGVGLPRAAPTGAAPDLVAVISDVVWRRHFARAPDIVGRTIRVNGVAVTVVGVAPRRFNGARTGGSRIRVWLPLGARAAVLRTPPGDHLSYDRLLFGLVARLRPGVSPGDAGPIVRSIAARAEEEMRPGRGAGTLQADVVPVLADNYFPVSGIVEEMRGRWVVLSFPFLLPALVLSITCMTVSVLQAGLSMARRREVAVRLALGASRARLVRQFVTESVVLALAGGALGLFVIWVLIQTLESTFPDMVFGIDGRTLAFTAGLALGAGALFGLTPALHATRLAVSEVLKDAAGALVPSRSRLQASLVVLQIALTQPALLVMGALFLEAASGMSALPSTASADRLVELRFNTNPRYGTLDDARERALARLGERLRDLPGVVAVVPQQNNEDSIELDVHPSDQVPGAPEGSGVRWVRLLAAPPEYFSVMGLAIARGRYFTANGSDDDAIVVSTSMARRLWGDVDPIGRRLVATGFTAGRPSTMTVVGVLADTSTSTDQRIYAPAVHLTGHLLVRTRTPGQAMIPALRSVANAELPELPVVGARTVASREDEGRVLLRRAMTAAGGVGMLALFLSAIGLYAVIAFAVSQRVREIGIRATLGADRRRLVLLFLRRGLFLSLAGAATGLALGLAALRIMTAATGQRPVPGTTAIAAAVVLVVTGVALFATWIPARRAARVDPLDALRMD